MAASDSLILGEYRRTLDDRFRLSIPLELAEPLAQEGEDCILAKELPGCLSLWSAGQWQDKLDSGIALVRHKIEAGRLEGRVSDVQTLGRLLSTRHKNVQLAGRSRLVIPEGFREFLGAEPGGDLLIVGAAVCVEIWRPDAWIDHLKERIPEFRQLFDNLAG